MQWKKVNNELKWSKKGTHSAHHWISWLHNSTRCEAVSARTTDSIGHIFLWKVSNIYTNQTVGTNSNSDRRKTHAHTQAHRRNKNRVRNRARAQQNDGGKHENHFVLYNLQNELRFISVFCRSFLSFYLASLKMWALYDMSRVCLLIFLSFILWFHLIL